MKKIYLVHCWDGTSNDGWYPWIEKQLNGDNVKAMLKQTQIKANVKGKMLFMPLRIALTGLMHGPDFTSLIQILGVDEVKERINEYLLQA